MQRIVSLLPSATEILCALGLRERLVGVSHECDHPPDVAGLPVLTEPKLDPRRRSGEIDRDVRALVAEGLGVYRIRTDALAEVRPDLIVTQDQCDVCAVSLADVEAAARARLGAGVAIVSLRPARLGDVFDDIRRVAAASESEPAATELIAGLEERLGRLRARHAHLRSRPRVACIEWLDPLMAAGHWIPDLVELAGGAYDLVRAGAPSPTLDWSALVAARPDVVVLMPCGFELEQTRRELSSLVARPEWRQLPAVRHRRAYAVDGNAYFNRPGPRIVDSAELLAGIVQPGFYAHLMPAGAWEPIASIGERSSV
jgi:iron complex transport system substrate-binding protein